MRCHVMYLCGRFTANGRGSPVAISLNLICYKYNIGSRPAKYSTIMCEAVSTLSSSSDGILANKQIF